MDKLTTRQRNCQRKDSDAEFAKAMMIALYISENPE